MADPLSIAASCAGLLSLAIQVIQTGYATVHSIKDFGDDIRKIMREVSQLTGLLTAMEPLFDCNFSRSYGSLLRREDLDLCKATLEEVKLLFEKSTPKDGHFLSNTQKRLLWDLRKTPLSNALRDHKMTFTLVLSSNSM